MTRIFKSEQIELEERRDLIRQMVALLKVDPDLRNQLRQVLETAGPPQAGEASKEIIMSTPTITIDTTPALIPDQAPDQEPTVPETGALGIPAGSKPNAIDPSTMPAPLEGEQMEPYLDRVVKPLGLDPTTWATAVLATSHWTWDAALINAVTNWARSLLDQPDNA